MNINKAFPSKFLKADDIDGHEPVVTVKSCSMQAMEAGNDQRPVLYFEGKEKGLVLNKTNANMLVELTGSPLTEQWMGTSIKLVVIWTEFQGKPIQGIRVRPANGKPVPVQAPQPTSLPQEAGDVEQLTAEDIRF